MSGLQLSALFLFLLNTAGLFVAFAAHPQRADPGGDVLFLYESE